MNQQELRDYNPDSLKVVKDLGKGSDGLIRVLDVRQLKQFVVEKEFPLVGNQAAIDKQNKEAQREAKMLLRIKHQNIVSVLGTTLRKNTSIRIIMEYAPCGDLETLLLDELCIPIPWNI